MATAADRKRPRGREADDGNDEARDRRLEPAEWRALTILGLPTFALALAITTVTTYLPVIASGFAASTVVIGVLIGGEGLLALTLPITVGTWSDRLHTRIGGRLPFVLGATPPLVLALALLGFTGSILTAALVVALFFVAYSIAYEPYRALYPDMVDDAIAGRAQSTQALFRGAATLPCARRRRPAPRDRPARPLRRGGRRDRAVAGGVRPDAAAPRRARPGARRPRREPGRRDAGAARRDRRGARAQGLPRRQRAVGAVARRAEDLRRPLHHPRPRVQHGVRVADHRRRGAGRARRRTGQRQARRPHGPRPRDAPRPVGLRDRPARPARDPVDGAARARHPARGVRGRRHHDPPLRAAHPAHAQGPQRRAERLLLPEPRDRHRARAAARRRGDLGGEGAARLDPGLRRDVGRLRRRCPRKHPARAALRDDAD